MIALFDMDGTLFAGDSQLRFARWILKRHGWRRLYLLSVLPSAILRAMRLLTTEQMKRIFLAYAWNMSAEELQNECREFVRQELLKALYPETLHRLRTHLKKGDSAILCSASPDWWTQLVGESLGFTHAIGTPIEPCDRIPFMPRIPAPGNNKGAAKLKRLAAIGITHADIGYTDSEADLPMISICDHAVLINPRPDFSSKVPNAEILAPARHLPPAFMLRCILGI